MEAAEADSRELLHRDGLRNIGPWWHHARPQLSGHPFDGPGISDSGRVSRVVLLSSRLASLECVIDKSLRSRHGELGAVRRPALCLWAAGSRGRRARSRGVAADSGASSRPVPRSRWGRDCGLPPVREAPERPRRAPCAIVLRDEWAVRFGSGTVSQRFARAFAVAPAVLAGVRRAGRSSRCAAQEGRRTSGCS